MNLNLSILSYYLDDLKPVSCGKSKQMLNCQDIRLWNEKTAEDTRFCYLLEWT